MIRRFFHGSRALLGRGSLLLPPKLTGATNALDLGYDHHDARRVYATADFAEACSYAITALIEKGTAAPGAGSHRRFVGAGKVFEVEVLGDVALDSDYDDYPNPQDFVRFERGIIRRVLDVPTWIVRQRLKREIAEYGKAELLR